MGKAVAGNKKPEDFMPSLGEFIVIVLLDTKRTHRE